MSTSHLSEDEHALYNPAFVGFLLFTVGAAYFKEREAGMHCALPFIVTPLLLDTSIAAKLPNNKRSSMIAWIARHEGELGDFSELVKSYRPVVLAAIGLLLEKSVLILHGDGQFYTGPANLPNPARSLEHPRRIFEFARRARFLGRWIGNSPPVETLYAQLGVRP